MRWIFFVLLGANALLLGWQLLFHKNDAMPAQRSGIQQSEDVPRILLLTEFSGHQSERGNVDKADKPAQTGADVLDAPIQPLCTFVGPFEMNEQAAQLVERLAAMDVVGRIADVEIPSGPGYWVYLAPLESRREALRSLSELQARGVDSFIIPKGDLMNGISLGMFSKEPLARAHVSEMGGLGLDAKIDIIERSYKEIWVSVPHAVAGKLGEQAWQRLLESNKTADRRQNYCLHVASKDNFH